MEKETLATEVLHELKSNSRRWLIAFIVVLTLWIATLGAFLWYLTRRINRYSAGSRVEENANTIIGVGDLNCKPSDFCIPAYCSSQS